MRDAVKQCDGWDMIEDAVVVDDEWDVIDGEEDYDIVLPSDAPVYDESD